MVASAFQDLQVIKENNFPLVVRSCVCLFVWECDLVRIYMCVCLSVWFYEFVYLRTSFCACVFAHMILCVFVNWFCVCPYICKYDFFLCPLIWKYKLIFATIIPCDSYICNYDSMRIRIFATIRLCLCSFISKYDFVFVRIFANIYILFMFEYLLQWF